MTDRLTITWDPSGIESVRLRHWWLRLFYRWLA